MSASSSGKALTPHDPCAGPTDVRCPSTSWHLPVHPGCHTISCSTSSRVCNYKSNEMQMSQVMPSVSLQIDQITMLGWFLSRLIITCKHKIRGCCHKKLCPAAVGESKNASKNIQMSVPLPPCATCLHFTVLTVPMVLVPHEDTKSIGCGQQSFVGWIVSSSPGIGAELLQLSQAVGLPTLCN